MIGCIDSTVFLADKLLLGRVGYAASAIHNLLAKLGAFLRDAPNMGIDLLVGQAGGQGDGGLDVYTDGGDHEVGDGDFSAVSQHGLFGQGDVAHAGQIGVLDGEVQIGGRFILAAHADDGQPHLKGIAQGDIGLFGGDAFQRHQHLAGLAARAGGHPAGQAQADAVDIQIVAAPIGRDAILPRAGQIVIASPDIVIGEHAIHRAVAHTIKNAQHAAVPGRLADGHVGVLKAVAGYIVRREGIGLGLHGGVGGADDFKEVEQIQAVAHCQRRTGQADDQRQGNRQYAKRTFYLHSILLHNVFQRAAHGVVKRRVHGRERPFQPLTVVFILHGSCLLRQVIAQQCFGAA